MAQRKRSGGRSSSSGSRSSAQDETLERGSGVGEHLVKPGASTVDAMGEDKRREVVGHSYGPSRRSQVVFFVAVAAVLVIVIGGYALAIATFDQPADDYPDKAPWSASDAAQIPTRSPAGPCGEHGNAYPPPADSPCAQKNTSTGEPAQPGTTAGRQEAGAGGPTAGGAESEPQEPPGN